MAELADAPDLGSGGEPRAGSSPVIRTFGRKQQRGFDDKASLLFFCVIGNCFGGHVFRACLRKRKIANFTENGYNI